MPITLCYPLALGSNSQYEWIESGSGTDEFYLQLVGGGQPFQLPTRTISNEPLEVSRDGVSLSQGTLGLLSESEWAWGNNDTLGFDTVYLRSSGGIDPDELLYAQVAAVACDDPRTYEAYGTIGFPVNPWREPQWLWPPNTNAAPVASSVTITEAAWTPADITTKGWFDASDATTITETANAVSQWDDKSPELEPVLMANGAEQPLINQHTINSLQTITFDGTNDVLKAATNVFGATVEKASVFYVAKSLDVANAGGVFNLSANGASGNYWYGFCPYSDGKLYFDNGTTGAGDRISVASGFSNNDVDMVSFAVGTNLQEIRVNGVQVASDATSTSCTTAGGIWLGEGNNGSHQNCALGEVIIMEGDVSVSDRQKIEGYLAHKWGQEGQLDAGHPYKSAAP